MNFDELLVEEYKQLDEISKFKAAKAANFVGTILGAIGGTLLTKSKLIGIGIGALVGNELKQIAMKLASGNQADIDLLEETKTFMLIKHNAHLVILAGMLEGKRFNDKRIKADAKKAQLGFEKSLYEIDIMIDEIKHNINKKGSIKGDVVDKSKKSTISVLIKKLKDMFNDSMKKERDLVTKQLSQQKTV